MVKVLTEKDTDKFIELRLKSLKDSPMAFGASFEEGMDWDQTFKNLKNKTNENYILGYFKNDRLVGIVGFVRETKLKKRHKSFIWGMYVDSDFRRMGIAKKLLQEVIHQAKKLEGLSKIILSVTQPQENALGFYEQLGFVKYSIEKDAIRVEGEKVDEIFMSLQL